MTTSFYCYITCFSRQSERTSIMVRDPAEVENAIVLSIQLVYYYNSHLDRNDNISM
jgi:hypothetical protein